MKKMLIVLAWALVIVAGATRAEATTLSYADAFYLGAIIPGIPPADDNQSSWITDLIGLAPGASMNCTVAPGTDICTRANSTVGGPFSTPVEHEFKVEGGVSRIGDGFTAHEVEGFQYVLAFYGGGQKSGASYVWFINGGIADGSVILPKKSQAAHGAKGLSHVSFFNRTSTTVPDGGTTLVLLGVALMGLGAAQRKFGS